MKYESYLRDSTATIFNISLNSEFRTPINLDTHNIEKTEMYSI